MKCKPVKLTSFAPYGINSVVNQWNADPYFALTVRPFKPSLFLKRFVSLFLLCSYLLSSPGLVYSMHFCGQELTAVSVAHNGDTNCCCQDTGKPAGRCCHDQKVSSALKDIKLSAAHFKLQAPAAAISPAVLQTKWQLSPVVYPVDEPSINLRLHAAPPPECPAYARGHAFLI